MTPSSLALSDAPRLTLRGAGVAAVGWALYAVVYAVAVTLGAGVPLAYSVQSQLVHAAILAALSVPVWLLVIREMDGAGVLRVLAAHAVLLPTYVASTTALYWAAYRLAGEVGVAEVLARQAGWIALGTAVLYVAQFAVYHAAALARQSARERAAAERLQARTREQELRSLRAQLNPHFLFNALTAISAQVGQDPDQAREHISQLGELLRYSLDSGRRDLVPLAEEVAFVRDYLALEQARMGGRLAVTVDVEPAALGAQVPPMALQTLVENAVRHGVAPKPEGGAVAVTARHSGGHAVLTVDDTGVGAAPADLSRPGGVGIANADERLQLLFGPDARLRIDTDRTGLGVSFRVPCDPAPARPAADGLRQPGATVPARP